MQILGGDLSGVVEAADADSKVFKPLISSLFVERQLANWLAAGERRQGIWAVPRLHLHLKMGCVAIEGNVPFCTRPCSRFNFCLAGTYAEFATIKSSLVASIPDNTSFDQAAAVPLVSLTAMQVCQKSVRPQT